jgi:acetyl esterase
LRILPSALIITAGCDPLLDEGREYSDKLKEAGVNVVYSMEPNIFHGYLNYYKINPLITPVAEKTLDYAASAIRENL